MTQQALANLIMADQIMVARLGPHLQRYQQFELLVNKMKAVIADPAKLARLYMNQEAKVDPNGIRRAQAIQAAGYQALQQGGLPPQAAPVAAMPPAQMPAQQPAFGSTSRFVNQGYDGMPLGTRPAAPAHPLQGRGAGNQAPAIDQIKPWQRWQALDAAQQQGQHRNFRFVHEDAA